MSQSEKEKLIERLEIALDQVRPHLKVDGGDVEIVDYTKEQIVKIKWLGNCENCFMSSMTMKAGIEQELKSKFPEVKAVEAINGIQV